MIQHRLARLERVLGAIARPEPPMTQEEACAILDEILRNVEGPARRTTPPAEETPEQRRLLAELRQRLGVAQKGEV